MFLKVLPFMILSILSKISSAQKKIRSDSVTQYNKDPWQSETFSGIKFRSIWPALTSGRIVDLAVNPKNTSEYYTAAGSGGVWKTIKSGITYQ